jgi:hypothetical protein
MKAVGWASNSITELVALCNSAVRRLKLIYTYFSTSFSFSTSKPSSQPTSISTLIPPSNSSKDCEAGDADCAPSKGVKLNIVAVIR